MKKIIFILLILGLALPASAWQESFEGHPNDMPLSQSNFNINNFTISSTDHGYNIYRYFSSILTEQKIIINQPFNNYLAYDLKYITSSSNYACYMKVIFTNSSGVNSEYTLVSDLDTLGLNYNKRVELIGNPGGTAFDLYINGIFINSFPYLNQESVDGTGNITLGFKISTSTKSDSIWLDNFVGGSDYSIVGCDNEFTTLDTYQYCNFGFPIPVDSYMFFNVYAPNGTIIQTENVSLATEYTIPKALISSGGTYSIKLFQHDNLSGNDYFYASRNFIFNQPSGVSLILDKEEYERSDQMQIFSYIPSSSFTSGYTVKIGYNAGDGTEYYTYSVPSSDYTKSYALSANSVGGSYSVYLIDPDGNTVASDEYYMSAPDGSTIVSLDKSTYETSDTIKISYTGAPAGSTLYMYLRDSSSVLYSKTWSLTTTSGVKSYDLSTYPDTTIVYVKIVKDSVLLADDRATVFSGEYYLSGKVYDSVTKAAVEGAQISVNGSSTTTNEIGYYETPVNAGLQTVTILCNGYQQFTSNVYISDLLSTQNFYIVPTASTGSDSLYGVVVDYYTGSPVTGSYVQISNGTNTYSMLTNSNTGNYAFTQPGLAGSWTITVTKTNYDAYSDTVTISGDTYKQIRLVPTNGYEDTEEDSSNETSTDRPGREAARESMEQFEALVPALIVLVVIKVIRELMK